MEWRHKEASHYYLRSSKRKTQTITHATKWKTHTVSHVTRAHCSWLLCRPRPRQKDAHSPFYHGKRHKSALYLHPACGTKARRPTLSNWLHATNHTRWQNQSEITIKHQEANIYTWDCQTKFEVRRQRNCSRTLIHGKKQTKRKMCIDSVITEMRSILNERKIIKLSKHTDPSFINTTN